MAYQKLQTSKGINIFPSDNANIPSANVVVSGTNSSVAVGFLVDATKDFIAANVAVGDVVVNQSTGFSATVLKVFNATSILINADIFTSPADSYAIYSQSANEGAVLYVGVTGDLRVITAGGQDVTFTGIIGGTFIPVQVTKVFSTGTTATNLVALW